MPPTYRWRGDAAGGGALCDELRRKGVSDADIEEA